MRILLRHLFHRGGTNHSGESLRQRRWKDCCPINQVRESNKNSRASTKLHQGSMPWRMKNRPKNLKKWHTGRRGTKCFAWRIYDIQGVRMTPRKGYSETTGNPARRTEHGGTCRREPNTTTADFVGPMPKVKSHFRPKSVTASSATCKSCWDSVANSRSSVYSCPGERSGEENNHTPGARRAAAMSPLTKRLKRRGERTRPWAMPESVQGCEREEPRRTWDRVPRRKWHINIHMRSWTLGCPLPGRRAGWSPQSWTALAKGERPNMRQPKEFERATWRLAA